MSIIRFTYYLKNGNVLHKVMQSLKEIVKKKILVIVAHPDDETLWFFQSIQILKEQNNVLILCMTHAAVSKRGRELQAVAEKYGLKVIFGHCEDTGINKLLRSSEVNQALIKVFSKHKFDLVITHPPHGGEKPHPHHLQMFMVTKEFSKFHSFVFGFFCEQKLLQNREPGQRHFLTFKRKKYVFQRLIQGFKLMVDENHRFSFLIDSVFDLISLNGPYLGYEAEVNVDTKHQALSSFESQDDVLKSYSSYYKKIEYLYIEERTPYNWVHGLLESSSSHFLSKS